MSDVILFFLGIILGSLGTYVVMRKHRVCEQHGISAYSEKQIVEKQLRKERIIEMLREKETITNDDIEKSLGISHPTVANYLHELVQEKRIEMIGERGRFVSYKLRGKL